MSNRQKSDVKAMTVTSTDDTGDFRYAELSALGTTQKCQVISPYGLCSNPPNDSLAIALNVQGIAANKVAIVDDPKNRKKELAKGEVAIVNYTTGAFVHIKQDNSIDIETPSGSKITLLSDGTIELTGNTTITGDLTVTGDILTEGEILADDDITSNAIINPISLTTHQHSAGGYNIATVPVTGSSGVPE